MRTVFASALALSVNTPTSADAQSEAGAAYRAAAAIGTVGALESFIEKYPLSPEANRAFRDIVTLSRGSTLSRSGPTGLSAGSASSRRNPPARQRTPTGNTVPVPVY